jgi:hypothetical protein
MDAPAIPHADRLIMERAQEDFEEGLEWVRTRLKSPDSGHSTFVAKAMEMGVMGAVSTLQLRPRYKDDVRFLLALAHRVNAGEDALTLARENLPRALRMKELALVARVREPEFQRVLDLALDIFAARLPDLARMIAVKEPEGYPDLVRRAFPNEAYVEAFLQENREMMLEMVGHFEKHPKLLRVPNAWVPSLIDIGRDMVEWESARVIASVRTMHARQA